MANVGMTKEARNLKTGSYSVATLVFLIDLEKISRAACLDMDVPCSEIVDASDATVLADKRNGFFQTLEDGTRSAVFAWRGEFFLQIGNRRWNWESDRVKVTVRNRWWRSFAKSVHVHAAGESQYHATYTSAAKWHIEHSDMTFDGLDELNEDWWAYLGFLSEYDCWRRVAKRWTSEEFTMLRRCSEGVRV